MGSKMQLALFLAILGVVCGMPDELMSNFELRDTNLDEPAYRLKDTVKPTHMNLDLDVYLDESRFNGLVQIVVEISEANLRQIVLHQKVVSISTVTVLDSANQVVPLQFPDPFETDDYYELLKINLASPIPVGTYTLTISYLGRINHNPHDRGFYRGYYFLNNQIHYYATTQFQPYHARKAFPCFDEPQFKSRYTISITRSSALGKSYSNMAIKDTQTVATGRIRETFLPTPTISAYLIAFHVSDFVETTATGTNDKPFGIISRPGGSAVTNQHQYAAEIGLTITNWMDNYYGLNYYDMGEGQRMKNDHIALPDFPSGAMENWGMVNYREAYLLYDEQNMNLPNKITIATIMAHELAHKWFGNLVTCFWWSNLWLNESFASFFEYFAAHGADPTLELDDQFVVDYVHSALSGDASAGANPMNWNGVVNNPSITSHFNFVSYAKGASVLRMMEHLVSPATFKKALASYLKDNAYGIGTAELMYQAFRKAVTEDGAPASLAGLDVGAVFDSWIQNPGAPVVKVDVDMSTGAMTVTQQRYQLSGNRPGTLWQIPLTYTRGGDINFENTTPSIILTTQSTVINKPAGHEWVIFNVAQSGYYRVNYDDHSWEMIAAALRTSRETIHKLNRAQIVNDVLFFVRSGDITIPRAFDVLSFLKDETDYYVWAGALGQLDWLRRRTEHIPQLYTEFSAYLLEQLTAVVDHLGYNEGDDSVSVTLGRMLTMNYACNLGHEGCVADALAKWQAFKANPTSNLVAPNLRRYVYCIGLREGDKTDYDFLWGRYNSSQSTADMVVMLRALACTKDQSLIQHYLQESLYSGTIRVHDKGNAFNFALQGNSENVKTVLDFVFKHYDEIRTQYGGSARLNIALNSLAGFLTNFEDIIAFQTWLYQNQLDLPDEFNTGVGVVSAAVNNLVWGNANAVELHTFMIGRGGAATMIAPITLLLAAVAVHLFRQ